MTTDDVEGLCRKSTKKQQNKNQIQEHDKISFQEKMKIKNHANNFNRICCVIKDIKYNNETAILFVSPEFEKSIVKTVRLDATFELETQSEFESFLKYNGISPYDEDFKNKLLDKSIELYVDVDENENIDFKYNKNTCYNDELSNKKDVEETENISRESPFSINREQELNTKSPSLFLFVILFIFSFFLLFIAYLPMIVLSYLF